MALPEVTLEVLDGALNIAPENIDGVHVKLGVSSLGTPNTLYSFTRPQDVKTQLGSGPLVEAAVHSLDVAGGPIYLMPVTAGTAGSNTVPVASGAGPAVTLTGTPLDRYEGIVQIVAGGAVGTATFKYTLDGGDNYSDVITTAATYLIPDTGITLNFAAGTYVAADTYTWTSTAPYFSVANLNSAFTALLALPQEWSFAHVVGRGTAIADSASMIAAVQTHMVAAATSYRYVSALVELAPDTDNNIVTGLASVTADRVVAVGGDAEMLSRLTGRYQRRHAGAAVAARAAKVAGKARVGIATDLGRVKDGPLPLITSLYRDEWATQALDAARVTTLRTIIGIPGFYITQAKTLATPGSDYSLWQRRRVIDKACRLVRTKMVEFLNDDVRTNTNGTIYEADARTIEAEVNAILEDNLVRTDNVVASSVAVDRGINVTSTNRVVVDVRVRSRGYLKDIRVTVGFEAPNIVLAEAA